jgi:hypothetical protein
MKKLLWALTLATLFLPILSYAQTYGSTWVELSEDQTEFEGYTYMDATNLPATVNGVPSKQ